MFLVGPLVLGNKWGDCTCLIVSQWQKPVALAGLSWVISEVTVHVWLSHSDKTNTVAFTGPLILWLSVRWLYMFDCLTVTKPAMLFYRTTGPLVISEVTVHVWLSHSDKINNVVYTGPLVLWLSVRWLYIIDCLPLTKPTMLFYRTTGPLVISEVTVHVWLSHSDKTNNLALPGPPVLW